MKVKKKIKLDADNLTTYYVIYEHCGKKHYTDKESLHEFTEITCCECEEPVLFRGSNGLWYYAGQRVFP